MEHSFDIEIAKKYGIPTAIILKHLHFWIEKNRANNKHYYDGCYWTYNSKKAFAELFPYMTERQVDYTLKKMIDSGLIIKGEYNKSAYDRTSWYALTDKGLATLQNCEIEESPTSQNCEVNKTKLFAQTDEIVQPIPDINTDINTDKKERPPEAVAKKEQKTFDEIIEEYTQSEELRELLKEYLRVRKYKGAATTNKSLLLCLDELRSITGGIELNQICVVRQAIMKGSVIFKPLPYVQQPAKSNYDTEEYEMFSNARLEELVENNGSIAVE